MISCNMQTEFASPERSDNGVIGTQARQVDELPMIHQLVDLLPEAFLILNSQRQIVFCNETFSKMMNLSAPKEIFGLRPGEALKCIHAHESKGGCGTTKYCVYCGAVNAILKSQDNQSEVQTEECRILSGSSNTAMDFRISAKTLTVENENYTIFIARDISDEKRRSSLEKIFFHDIMNTAGGIHGIVGLLNDADADELEELVHLVESSSATLIEEINAQKDLLAAESGDLKIKSTPLNSAEILNEVRDLYTKHEVGIDKQIIISDNIDSIDFQSDSRLIKRIVGNMLKNALEASSSGESVTLSVKKIRNSLEFHVHNSGVMPKEAQMQLFQRSYSTKGTGRGLGTYSIKLLGETFLKGTVSFRSEEGKGTTFIFTLPVEG